MSNAPKTMALRAAPARGISGKVDRKNGIIHGVAIVTMGEARGHGVNLDEEFVDATVDNINKTAKGIKSRFGHPNMSSSAIGSYLGLVKNAYDVDANGKAISRGDLHLSESAKKSPQGNLWEYVLNMAETDPEQFGTSIVFDRGNQYKRDENGEKVFQKHRDDMLDDIDSPWFIEQKRLRANDIVDEPAANPGGLFSADQPAAIVTQFLDENPEIWEMLQDEDVDEIFNSFAARYEAYRATKPSIDKPNPTEEPPQMAEDTKKTEDVRETTVAELASLKTAFPNDLAFAVESFEKGHTVEQAKASYCDKLQSANDALTAKVAELETELAAKPEVKTAEYSEGADPVEHAEAHLQTGKTKSKKAEAEEKIAAFQASGMTHNQAVVALNAKHPELIDELTKA